MSFRRWRFFVEDMLKAIESIQAFVSDTTFEEISRNNLVQAAVEGEFIILGEAVRHIPNEIMTSHPAIPWREMADLRNTVAHVYWGVDSGSLWDTIHQDLPEIIPLRYAILAGAPD